MSSHTPINEAKFDRIVERSAKTRRSGVLRAVILLALLLSPLAGYCGKKDRQPGLDAIRAEVEKQLAAGVPCCAGANEYGEPISIDGTDEIALSYEQPLKQFEEGRSHFLLLQLPESSTAYAMTIYEIAPWVETYGFVWPIVLLLDENFEVVWKETLDRKDGKFWGQIPSPMQRLKINPARHRYAVIYTDPALFGRETKVLWDVGTVSETITAPYVPTGMLRIAFHRTGMICSMSYNSESCLVKAKK